MGQVFEKNKELGRTSSLAMEERDGEKEKFLTYRIVRICRRCRYENDIVKRSFGMFGSHGAFEVDEVDCPRHGQSVRGDILLFRVRIRGEEAHIIVVEECVDC